LKKRAAAEGRFLAKVAEELLRAGLGMKK